MKKLYHEIIQRIYLKKIFKQYQLKKPKKIIVFGKKFLKPIKLKVSGDLVVQLSLALALLNKNSKIKITNVGLNPTRTGFRILKNHKAKIKFINVKKKIMKFVEIYCSK